jgi:integrase
MARGSIVRRGASWRLTVELPPDGTGRRQRVTATVAGSKRDAQRRLTELLAQADQQRLGATPRMTLAEYLDVWLRDYTATKAPKTQRVYRDLVRHVVPRLGSVPIGRLTPSHLVGLFSALREVPRHDGNGTLALTTVHAVYRVLRTALNTAVRWQLLTRSPLDGVDPPSVPRQEMKCFDAHQARRFLAAADEEGTRWGALFTVLLQTGCRPGELKALRWEDLDLATGRLYIRRHVQRLPGHGFVVGDTKTASGRRALTLGPDVVGLLRRHRAEQAECRLRAGPLWHNLGLVFPSEVGGYLEAARVTRVFRRICDRANLPRIRLYDLRHTSATLLLASGVDLKTVSERLGHTDATLVLTTYGHTLPGAQEAASRTLEELLKRAT